MERNRRPVILLISLILCVSSLYAQKFEAEIREALQTKPKFEFRLDSRTSFINQTGVRVFGLKVGFQFDEKLSFGLGYNFLLSSIRNDIETQTGKASAKLKFRYLSPYVEYVFYRDEKWELSIPVQFGFGQSFYHIERNAEDVKLNNQFVLSYEPAITFQYRFLSYFGAGMGVGYRLMLVPNSEIDEQLTSPVYLFKFKIYFQDLWKDLNEIE